MTIDLLKPLQGVATLPSDASETGSRLHEALVTYLRGTYHVSAQRLFVGEDVKWVALDSHAANTLEQAHGYERQNVIWRRPGKDLFSIYRKGDRAIAIGMLHDRTADGPDVIGYFELVPAE